MPNSNCSHTSRVFGMAAGFSGLLISVYYANLYTAASTAYFREEDNAYALALTWLALAYAGIASGAVFVAYIVTCMLPRYPSRIDDDMHFTALEESAAPVVAIQNQHNAATISPRIEKLKLGASCLGIGIVGASTTLLVHLFKSLEIKDESWDIRCMLAAVLVLPTLTVAYQSVKGLWKSSERLLEASGFFPPQSSRDRELVVMAPQGRALQHAR